MRKWANTRTRPLRCQPEGGIFRFRVYGVIEEMNRTLRRWTFLASRLAGKPTNNCEKTHENKLLAANRAALDRRLGGGLWKARPTNRSATHRIRRAARRARDR